MRPHPRAWAGPRRGADPTEQETGLPTRGVCLREAGLSRFGGSCLRTEPASRWLLGFLSGHPTCPHREDTGSKKGSKPWHDLSWGPADVPLWLVTPRRVSPGNVHGKKTLAVNQEAGPQQTLDLQVSPSWTSGLQDCKK